MVLYAGTFFGYILIPFATDNYGRKFSMVASWSLTLLGIFILSISVNILMASIGLFLAGFGCESGIRTTMTILGEVVENTLRQKYSTALSISFGIGEILIGLIYFLLKDWRKITVLFCLLPAIFQLLLLIFYLE
jgi:MFS family permease